MRTERKRFQSFLLLIVSCVLLFTGFGCGGGQAAYSSDSGQSGQNNPPPPITDLLSNPPPPAPNWMSVVPSTNQVFLDWSDESSREDGFIVFRDEMEIARTTRNDSKYTDAAVSPGTTYTYAVVAYNKEGSNVSAERVVTTLPLPPTAPSNLATQVDATGVTLSWTDTPDEDGYRVKKGGAIVQTMPADVTSWKDTVVTAGATYCYAITAFNQGGESPQSIQQCGTVPYPNTPPILNIWYPLEGELVYKLTRVRVCYGDDDSSLNIRTFINNIEQARTEVQTSTSCQWLEIDFTGYPEGNHAVEVEVADSHGAVSTKQVGVHVNYAELEKKAIDFLYYFSSYGPVNSAHGAVRWQSLPIKVEVSPAFPVKAFEHIQNAANYLTKYTGIPFEVIMSDIAIDYTTIDGWWCTAHPDWIVSKHIIYIDPRDSSLGYAATCNKIQSNIYLVLSSIIDMPYNDLEGMPLVFERIMAHELGHALPVGGMMIHETGEYLMSPKLIDRVSPEMVRAMEKLYFEMQPGDSIPVPAP